MPRVLISEPGETPQPYRFDLEHKIVKIGRGSDNDIVIKCRSVSTKHCNMERVKGGYILRDKGSTNGIKLDDSLMEIIDLIDGTEVSVGDVSMEFQLTDNEIAELGEEKFTSRQKKKLPPIHEEEKKAPGKQKEKEPEGGKSKPKPKPEAAPKLKSKPRDPSNPSPVSSYSPYSSPAVQKSGSPLSTLVVFMLVLVAVFAGMTLRHKMRTGEFLPTKVMNWLNGNPAPEKSTDAGEEEQPDEAKTPESESEDLETSAVIPEMEDEAWDQDTTEILSDELILQLNMAFNAITEAEDKLSAEFAAEQLTTSGNKITSIAKRLDRLDTPDEEEKMRLADKMAAVRDANADKMKKFMPVLFGNEEVGDILMPAIQGFEKQMRAHEKVFERFGMNQQKPAE